VTFEQRYNKSDLHFCAYILKQVCIQPRSSAVNVTLPAYAAERGACCMARAARHRQASIDITCPQGTQQQTRRTSLLLSIDGTDRRTLDRFM